MELYELRYFYEVANRGGLGDAASALHVSIPAVSKAIVRLEEKLGCTLFDRSKRRLILTDEGKHFLIRSEEILSLANKTIAEMSKPTQVKELSIAGREVFLDHFALSICRLFRTKHPAASCVLKAMSGEAALQSVEVGQSHLAITLQSPPKGWTSLDLGEIKFVTCASGTHPLGKRAKHGDSISVKELCSFGFVSPNTAFFGRVQSSHSIDGWRDDVHPRRIDYVIDSLSIYSKLLQSGEGLGYLPDFWAKRLGLIPISVKGCSFQVKAKVYLSAKRAKDLGWLDSLLGTLR